MKIDQIERLNKLAKSLKDTGLAKTMDDALMKAAEMLEEKGVAELSERDISQENGEETECFEKTEERGNLQSQQKEIRVINEANKKLENRFSYSEKRVATQRHKA